MIKKIVSTDIFYRAWQENGSLYDLDDNAHCLASRAMYLDNKVEMYFENEEYYILFLLRYS